MIITQFETDKNEKKRNVALTILISIFIIIDSYLLKTIIDSNPNNDFTDLGQNVNYLYVVFTVLDFIFGIYLFKWKKWAFWGTSTVSILTFFLNLYVGVEFQYALLGLVGIILLFGFLQLKSNNVPGWKNLE